MESRGRPALSLAAHPTADGPRMVPGAQVGDSLRRPPITSAGRGVEPSARPAHAQPGSIGGARLVQRRHGLRGPGEERYRRWNGLLPPATDRLEDLVRASTRELCDQWFHSCLTRHMAKQ